MWLQCYASGGGGVASGGGGGGGGDEQPNINIMSRICFLTFENSDCVVVWVFSIFSHSFRILGYGLTWDGPVAAAAATAASSAIPRNVFYHHHYYFLVSSLAHVFVF